MDPDRGIAATALSRGFIREEEQRQSAAKLVEVLEEHIEVGYSRVEVAWERGAVVDSDAEPLGLNGK